MSQTSSDKIQSIVLTWTERFVPGVYHLGYPSCLTRIEMAPELSTACLPGDEAAAQFFSVLAAYSFSRGELAARTCTRAFIPPEAVNSSCRRMIIRESLLAFVPVNMQI